MYSWWKRVMVASVGVVAVILLASCNTIHGMGEDITAGGKALTRAASSGDKNTTKSVATTNHASQAT